MRGTVNRRTSIVALAGLASLVAACSGEPAGSPAAAPDATVMMTIDLEAEANAQLSHVADGVLLDGGGAVLLTAEPPFLHRFGPDGVLLQSGVAKGAGPGELWFPRQLLQCGGDSLFVWEQSRRQLMVYDAAFAFVRATDLPGSPQRLACNRAGQVVALAAPGPEAFAGLDMEGEGRFVRPRTRLYRATTRGDSLPGTLEVPFAAANPMSARTSVALTDSLVVVATAESLAVAWLDLELQPLGGWAEPGWIARAATEADYGAAVDEELAMLPAAMQGQLKAEFMAGPHPPEVPPYRDMAVSEQGTSYLLTSAIGDSVPRVLVATPAGPGSRVIRLPADGRLLDAMGSLLLLATGPSEEHARVVVMEVATP